jgi:hypothetical protein
MQTKPLTPAEAQLAGNFRTPPALRKALNLRYEAYKAELRLEKIREATGHTQGAATRPGLGIAENPYDRAEQMKVDSQLVGTYHNRPIQDPALRERVAAARARLRAAEGARHASGDLALAEEEFRSLAFAAANAQAEADREARHTRIRELRAELDRMQGHLRRNPTDASSTKRADEITNEIAALVAQG